MMEHLEISNAAKEVLCMCEYIEPEVTMKIPFDFIMKLKELASNANIDVRLDYSKKLSEQNISETAKDMLALIYYSYIATETEKVELKEHWDKNEKKYKEYIKEKYAPEKIFKKQEKIDTKDNEIIVYNKSFISRIIEKIKGMFNKN